MARSRSPPPCHRLKDTSNCPGAYQQSRVRNGRSCSSVSRSPKKLVASFLRIFKKKSVSELRIESLIPSFSDILKSLKGTSSIAENSQDECIICRENRRTVALAPCNHLCYCIDCCHGRSISDNCPVCKASQHPLCIFIYKISAYLPIFSVSYQCFVYVFVYVLSMFCLCFCF